MSALEGLISLNWDTRCELLCGCLELSRGPVEEEPVLLTTEQSLQTVRRFLQLQGKINQARDCMKCQKSGFPPLKVHLGSTGILYPLGCGEAGELGKDLGWWRTRHILLFPLLSPWRRQLYFLLGKGKMNLEKNYFC